MIPGTYLTVDPLPDIVKVKYQVYTGVAVVVVRAVVVVVDAVVVVFGVVVVTLSSFNRSSRNSDVSVLRIPFSSGVGLSPVSSSANEVQREWIKSPTLLSSIIFPD